MFQSTTNIQVRMQDELNKLNALIAFGNERGLATRWIDAHSRINDIWFNRFGVPDNGCVEFVRQSIDEVSELERVGALSEYQAQCIYGAVVALYADKNFLQHCRKFGMR
jgi:hypothetical protein